MSPHTSATHAVLSDSQPAKNALQVWGYERGRQKTAVRLRRA
jgi:hypothetical protein